jgi:tetratricopeptide (TPR) repeat protein
MNFRFIPLRYQLLYTDKKKDAAIEIFTLNTKQYPASSNAFDSLAEAYAEKGNKKLAITNYEKAIQFDPGNVNSAEKLKKLK